RCYRQWFKEPHRVSGKEHASRGHVRRLRAERSCAPDAAAEVTRTQLGMGPRNHLSIAVRHAAAFEAEGPAGAEDGGQQLRGTGRGHVYLGVAEERDRDLFQSVTGDLPVADEGVAKRWARLS